MNIVNMKKEDFENVPSGKVGVMVVCMRKLRRGN